jgi:hypothetical protein
VAAGNPHPRGRYINPGVTYEVVAYGGCERKRSIERRFIAIVALIWVMLSAILPLVNRPDVHVLGIPLLWFWVLLWVFVVPVVLSVAYYVLEVAP